MTSMIGVVSRSNERRAAPSRRRYAGHPLLLPQRGVAGWRIVLRVCASDQADAEDRQHKGGGDRRSSAIHCIFREHSHLYLLFLFFLSRVIYVLTKGAT
jgi:hypothetical protein